MFEGHLRMERKPMDCNFDVRQQNDLAKSFPDQENSSHLASNRNGK